MEVLVFDDPDSVARKAAAFIAAEARTAVAARGQFVAALSGGRTPWLMLRALASAEIPWDHIQLAQVDERVAPTGDPDRNLSHLLKSLETAPLRPNQIHAMPVESTDLEAAALCYARTLGEIAGFPPVFDLVHLGIGTDGHTASLIPGDRVLEETHLDVTLTGVISGRRRMTLTFPILNRSRRILWVITGQEKAGILARLSNGDDTIPAGRIRRDQAIVFADRMAAFAQGRGGDSHADQ